MKPDKELQRDVLEERQWDPSVEAAEIGVTAWGKVTPKGDVRSWSEREEAERMAWAAPGVRAGENQLTITPRSASL